MEEEKQIETTRRAILVANSGSDISRNVLDHLVRDRLDRVHEIYSQVQYISEEESEAITYENRD